MSGSPDNRHGTRTAGRDEGQQPPRRSVHDLVIRARRFAADVALDDATFVHAFLAVLNEGADIRGRGLLPGRDLSNLIRPIPSASLLAHCLYAANARWLYTEATTGVIVGRRTRASEHRECVLLRAGTAMCGGVLIAPDVVLTAAHSACADRESYVMFGPVPARPERVIRAARVVVHPAYDRMTHANDLALVVLAEAVHGVPYARIAPAEAVDRARAIRIVGYAPANTLDPARSIKESGAKRTVHVPVASAGCAADDEQHTFRCHRGAELVAGKPALASDGCRGDTGSPCYVRVGNRWCLAGIASRPIPGYQFPCGDGAIYVRVHGYEDWMGREGVRTEKIPG